MAEKKYTKEQIDFVQSLVEQGFSVTESTRKMCEHFNIVYGESLGRLMRKKMQKRGVKGDVVNIEDTDEFKEAQKKEHDKKKKRFLISWAQSETPVHKNFIKNMETYASRIDAEILIICGRYRNPNSLRSSKAIEKAEKNKEHSWAKEILPYLDANRHNLHKYLQVLSDVKVQPTASTPLSGMNSITGLESCIIGHPRVQMLSLPVAEGYPHKLLLTTGACTLPNYTDTKVGKRSEFHHQIAFIVVELDGKDFHVRQVVADKFGNFYDLVFKVEDGEVFDCCSSVPAIVFGDLHLGEENKEAVEASFRMAEILKPEKIVLHDVVDSGSISHHEQKDPFALLRREEDGSWSLERELNNIVNWFKKYPQYKFLAVSSNHDDFIDRWVRNVDWRKSLNKKLYLDFANAVAKGEAPKGLADYYFRDRISNLQWIDVNESYTISDILVSAHGHLGVHGARASINQLKTLPTKLITGHSHVPSRHEGHLCVGTLTKLRLGYNKGFSAWLASNVVIYPNGKTSHINIINGKFTTLI